jgi:hypothetical protein
VANTPNGLPYPVGTDLVVNGDDAIAALAQKVDTSLLPHGYARARCLTAASAGANAWNLCWLDALADVHGAQPWQLVSANRWIWIQKAGVYSLSGFVTMSAANFGVAIGLSLNSTTWDRIAGSQFGTANLTNGVSTVRYLPVDCLISLMFSHPVVQNTAVDAFSSPSYLAIQALGGQ